ncbi:MAG: hypothetical protein ATN36_05330 [Epulopiscium sp. Nele67-Bin005]|nr:MAG: hypothetical protein ATN36_05330 [Epulopiscium sp. Nele67-Bin005]
MFYIGILSNKATIIESFILEYSKTNLVNIEIEIFETEQGLFNYLLKNKLDLIFLNVISGLKTGLTIRNNLENYSTQLVFIPDPPTITRAVENYEDLLNVNSLKFLPYNLSINDIWHILELVQKKICLETPNFVYISDYSLQRVDLKDIIYFENCKKKITIVTTTGSDYFTGSLTSIQEKLPTQFVRIYRSLLVNVNYINKVDNHYVVLKNNKTLPIARNKINMVKALIYREKPYF